MASRSANSSSPTHSLSSNYEAEDSANGGFRGKGGMSGENLEKSLTNLNIHNAHIVEQREEMDRVFKEFCARFAKQQEIDEEETKQLRMEMMMLRKNTKHGG